ncbi:aminopeptidase [Zea mays]|uniref:Aminopeptidase n=1 Tax=Zea mays TaxID=4577 RepID=A0A1D6EI04_MAIZE|nr:aminopeptidase [Zea mays]
MTLSLGLRDMAFHSAQLDLSPEHRRKVSICTVDPRSIVFQEPRFVEYFRSIWFSLLAYKRLSDMHICNELFFPAIFGLIQSINRFMLCKVRSVQFG